MYRVFSIDENGVFRDRLDRTHCVLHCFTTRLFGFFDIFNEVSGAFSETIVFMSPKTRSDGTELTVRSTFRNLELGRFKKVAFHALWPPRGRAMTKYHERLVNSAAAYVVFYRVEQNQFFFQIGDDIRRHSVSFDDSFLSTKEPRHRRLNNTRVSHLRRRKLDYFKCVCFKSPVHSSLRSAIARPTSRSVHSSAPCRTCTWQTRRRRTTCKRRCVVEVFVRALLIIIRTIRSHYSTG